MIAGLLARRSERLARGVVHRAAHVAAAHHGARTILLDARRGRYYGLDEVGGRIWELLEPGASLARVVDTLEQEYDAPRAVLAADTAALLARLWRRGLVGVET
ncbi:MAG: PqqD family protein [Gemmatimonadetes bacterium]|nr:PqqD family protein [Gemmatimonadota bacterium]